MNRSDVMEQFGLSVNQASSDLSRYLGFAPDNMVYDKRARTYVRGLGFKPVFDKLGSGRYLAQLRSVSGGLLDHEDCWIINLTAYDAALTPARGVNPITLRSVIDAIRPADRFHATDETVARGAAAVIDR